MYIPAEYEQKAPEAALQFLEKEPFGTLVTPPQQGGLPFTTHLPFFLLKGENPTDFTLYSHLARENEHSDQLNGRECMIIFNGPHAYISPENYDKPSVPTWNYVTLHLQGTTEVVSQEGESLELMNRTIQSFEPSFQEKWAEYSSKYKEHMMKNILMFRVIPDKIEMVEKLSQDKSQKDKERVIKTLSQSKDPKDHALAQYMAEKFKIPSTHR